MRILLLFILFASYTASAQKLKPISTYLAHKKVSKEAKKFYKNLPVYKKDPQIYYAEINIEMIVGGIMDSVTAENISLRPFYLYLMNRNMDLADGALLLMVILKQYEILETEPALFFQYMLDNPLEKKNYFSRWAGNMSGFTNQYCPGFMNMEEPACMQEFKTTVFKKLPAKSSPKLLSLAKDFMVLMKIPDQLPDESTEEMPGKDNKSPIQVGEKDNGKTIQVPGGKVIKATFRECRGCASVWKISNADLGKVTILNNEYANPSCTDCVGGNHDRSILFTVNRLGITTLTFTYFEQKVIVSFLVK